MLFRSFEAAKNINVSERRTLGFHAVFIDWMRLDDKAARIECSWQIIFAVGPFHTYRTMHQKKI